MDCHWLNNWQQRGVINGVSFEWLPLFSSVAQCSVPGSVLFIVYINNDEVWLSNFISKFADDAKTDKSVLSDEDRQNTRKDFHTISGWSDTKQMPIIWLWIFQIQNKKNNFDYKIRCAKLKSVKCVKYLDIKIALSLKFSQQCDAAAMKAIRMLCLKNRSFLLNNTDVIIKVYNSLVRHHLENAAQYSSSHCEKYCKTGRCST